MYYIQVTARDWNKRKFPVKKASYTSKQIEEEAIKARSSQLAQAKTTEYIRNIQQHYYLERRLFS